MTPHEMSVDRIWRMLYVAAEIILDRKAACARFNYMLSQAAVKNGKAKLCLPYIPVVSANEYEAQLKSLNKRKFISEFEKISDTSFKFRLKNEVDKLKAALESDGWAVYNIKI